MIEENDQTFDDLADQTKNKIRISISPQYTHTHTHTLKYTSLTVSSGSFNVHCFSIKFKN